MLAFSGEGEANGTRGASPSSSLQLAASEGRAVEQRSSVGAVREEQ